VDRYFFYRVVLTDIVPGQQVQWSQVFQHEDPGEEDPVCMHRADSHSQSSAGPAW
jgi:hypothetical protein